MKIWWVGLLLVSSSAMAAKVEKVPVATWVSVWKVGKETKRIRDFPEQRITLSESCGPVIEKMTCTAALVLKTVSAKSIRGMKLGSRNPGSVLCSEGLHEQVVIATDSHRNENSFCVFKDGSLVDTGTLIYYGRENDKK